MKAEAVLAVVLASSVALDSVAVADETGLTVKEVSALLHYQFRKGELTRGRSLRLGSHGRRCWMFVYSAGKRLQRAEKPKRPQYSAALVAAW